MCLATRDAFSVIEREGKRREEKFHSLQEKKSSHKLLKKG
jgi:hypothetical protein